MGNSRPLAATILQAGVFACSVGAALAGQAEQHGADRALHRRRVWNMSGARVYARTMTVVTVPLLRRPPPVRPRFMLCYGWFLAHVHALHGCEQPLSKTVREPRPRHDSHSQALAKEKEMLILTESVNYYGGVLWSFLTPFFNLSLSSWEQRMVSYAYTPTSMIGHIFVHSSSVPPILHCRSLN